MARRPPRLPADDIRPYNLTIRDFRPGTITLLEENRTPPGGVVQSDNVVQVQDGVWAPKWGADYYNLAIPAVRQGSPAVTTNLIDNPSFEIDMTGWGADSNVSLTRDLTQHNFGTASAKAVRTGGVGVRGFVTTTATALLPSTAYVFSFWAKIPVGNSISVLLSHNTDTVTPQLAAVAGTGAWQFITLFRSTTATVGFGMLCKIYLGGSFTAYFDGFQIERGVTATPYFDGDVTDTAAIDYAWTGTVGNSPSTKSVYVYGGYNLDGAFEAVLPDDTLEILEVAGGTLYRSVDGGTKTPVTISPGTLTPGYDCHFLQIRGFVYIGNGHDPVVRYDTTLHTAASYTALATPVAATLAKTGLSGTNYTAYYVIVATNLVGTTVGSPEASVTVGKVRDEWVTSTTAQNTTDLITLTLTRVTNAVRYSIFYSDQSGKELYLDSVPDPGTGTTFTYVDRGTQPINDFVELPNDDTTGGPLLTQMELSSNRIWGLDGANKQRVIWSGVGQYTGTFSPYYGGGYVDLELGGREKPAQIVHYRDGKGTAMATVLTRDPQGNGSTWQITLDTVTVGTTTFLIPNPVKIVGSIGCTSPRGAAKVGDDIVFANNKGAYSLGSQPSIVNVLATRELSANIRNRWRALDGAAMAKAALYFYDAKIFCAVPASAGTNSEIWVRDTEKRNWQVAWQGVGVKAFLEHTDSTGRVHFLGVPAKGNQLIEFSPDIRGNFGVAAPTKIKTGRLPINPKNHNDFAQIDKMFVELGNPIGTISVDFYGYEYRKGFIFLGNLTVSTTPTSSVPWGSQWSTRRWSVQPGVPVISSSSVYRRFKRINKLVNSLQYVLSTTGIGDYYELLEFSAQGYSVKVDPPRIWKSTSLPPAADPNAIVDSSGSAILI